MTDSSTTRPCANLITLNHTAEMTLPMTADTTNIPAQHDNIDARTAMRHPYFVRTVCSVQLEPCCVGLCCVLHCRPTMFCPCAANEPLLLVPQLSVSCLPNTPSMMNSISRCTANSSSHHLSLSPLPVLAPAMRACGLPPSWCCGLDELMSICEGEKRGWLRLLPCWTGCAYCWCTSTATAG